MLSQLLNIIKDYSTSIEKINTEYHNNYQYYYDNDILYLTFNKLYNYRVLSDTYASYTSHLCIRDKTLRYAASLPKNYV